MPAERFAGVCASFTDQKLWRAATFAAQASGQVVEAYGPVADEATMRLLRPLSTQHPVRLWTLLGGMFGGFAAFAMTIWMSRNWPLVVGGKPIVSWPPFICICFEMTVLYASFACMGSFFAYARLPHLTLPAAYRPEFAVDHFGLFIACAPLEAEHWQRQLTAAGAQWVWHIDNQPRGRLALPSV
jgi:hypothetical protein